MLSSQNNLLPISNEPFSKKSKRHKILQTIRSFNDGIKTKISWEQK